MNNLNDVTAVIVDTRDSSTAAKVLNFCSNIIKFNRAILFTNTSIKSDNFETILIPSINSIAHYNQFILKFLAPHINTSHCLIMQNDGFIINPHLWDQAFLKYDYIGAAWPKSEMRYGRRARVGNGGFSLRSKRLLHTTLHDSFNDFNTNEDIIIAEYLHDHKSFKVPDVDIAYTFSQELQLEDFKFDLTKNFGFHGKHIYHRLITLHPDVLRLKNIQLI